MLEKQPEDSLAELIYSAKKVVLYLKLLVKKKIKSVSVKARKLC